MGVLRELWDHLLTGARKGRQKFAAQHLGPPPGSMAGPVRHAAAAARTRRPPCYLSFPLPERAAPT